MRFLRAAALSAVLLLSTRAWAQKTKTLSTPLTERTMVARPSALDSRHTAARAYPTADSLDLPPAGQRLIALDSASMQRARLQFLYFIDSLRHEKGLPGRPVSQSEFTAIAQQTADRLVHATVSDVQARGHYYGKNASFSARMDNLGQYCVAGTLPSECIQSHYAFFDPQDRNQLGNELFRAAWELFKSSEHERIVSSPLPGAFFAGVGILLKEQQVENSPGLIQLTVVYIPTVLQNAAPPSPPKP